MAKCKFYKPYFDTLKKIIDGYYKLPGCGAGGPLHILLDDDNYDIGSINFCIDYCFKNRHEYENEVCTLGIMICNEYAKMSLEERAAFDAYLCGDPLECTGKCSGFEDCDVFGELYEYMKEAERRV